MGAEKDPVTGLYVKTVELSESVFFKLVNTF